MEQSDLLRLVGNALEANGIVYGFTGSQASSLYGENRFTNDIDVVVDIRNAQKLRSFLAAFPSTDFYVNEQAALQAIANGGQFNIIHPESAQKVDVIIRVNPQWPEELSRRRQMMIADGSAAWFIAPEDLILHKMRFYQEGGSDKHLRDIAAILRIAGVQIDSVYLETWSERVGLGDIWREVVSRTSSSGSP